MKANVYIDCKQVGVILNVNTENSTVFTKKIADKLMKISIIKSLVNRIVRFFGFKCIWRQEIIFIDTRDNKLSYNEYCKQENLDPLWSKSKYLYQDYNNK